MAARFLEAGAGVLVAAPLRATAPASFAAAVVRVRVPVLRPASAVAWASPVRPLVAFFPALRTSPLSAARRMPSGVVVRSSAAVLFAVLFAVPFPEPAFRVLRAAAAVPATGAVPVVREAFLTTVADFRAAPVPAPAVSVASSVPDDSRGLVSHATAAPVTATGHSTRPATPSTPAPVYTATRRPRGDTAPIRSSTPPAARPTVPAPGTRPSTEAAAFSGPARSGRPGSPGSRRTPRADFCSAMTYRPPRAC
ncbi:hypothetical protein [Streptomyces sp. CRN 30]|uniref:hypothetical protein n=1 Tax=Streptomyces sp. CRN 30 TaxID=3075613 RepID=UPI0039C0D47A